MRQFAVIFLLVFSVVVSGQSVTIKSISLEEVISLTIRNNPTIQYYYQKKKLTRDVKSAYLSWLYQINKLKTIQQQLLLSVDLERIAELRYSSGDIDLLEKSTTIAQLAEVKTSFSMLENEIEITKNQLKQLLFSDDEIVPSDTGLFMYQVNKEPDKESHPDSLSHENQHALLKKKHHRKNLKLTESEILYQMFVTDKTIENLRLQLNSYFNKLQYFNSFGLERVNLILGTSRTKFDKEDIDYFEYSKLVSEAFNIKLEYLRALNDYNQTAIQLEYYAY